MPISIARAMYEALFPGAPVFESRKPSGDLRACDFCATESRSNGGIYLPLHFYRVTPSINFGIMTMLGGRGTLIDDNGWGACAECQAAIDGGDRKRLQRRMAQTLIVMAQAENRYRGSATVQECRRFAADLVTVFWLNRWTGPEDEGRMRVMAGGVSHKGFHCPACGDELCEMPILTTAKDSVCYTYQGKPDDWRNGKRFHLKSAVDAMMKTLGATAIRVDYSDGAAVPHGFIEHDGHRVDLGEVEAIQSVPLT